ncbi:protein STRICTOSIDINE SYNTHASE-LIKE 6-like [Mercurialis annua]|uniref:protein STRICTOSIDINE SYNTHASE-LIKE 6-like n=1 Tax=Mercurialis annua TaxID=3986 RepID=UPI00215E5A65|nr:protein STRICTOSIDINE SYNTHASE-LIKE 6-like [Mercurialis annua]
MTSEFISKKKSCPFLSIIIFSVIILILGAILLYRLDWFDSPPSPNDELTHPFPTAMMKDDQILKGSYLLGLGNLAGPEDIVYDSKSKIIYTGCSDGWIKRVTVTESVGDTVVENWVNTTGRPLGLALGLGGEVIVADAYKGLLKISRDGAITVLTHEAEGLKFKLTDGVDIAKNGKIYFTDASYKYNLTQFLVDLLEQKPHGRLLCYDPSTKTTRVLLRDLYFANGIALSPDQDYLVFCETPKKRCGKYYIEGKKKGSIEHFFRLPGYPDNIHYNGRGHFWVAAAMEIGDQKYIGGMDSDMGGVFVVNLEGKLINHYHDASLMLISSAVKINNYLYCGSIVYPYIIRLDLAQNPAYSSA